jgi:hypothetical protein
MGMEQNMLYLLYVISSTANRNSFRSIEFVIRSSKENSTNDVYASRRWDESVLERELLLRCLLDRSLLLHAPTLGLLDPINSVHFKVVREAFDKAFSSIGHRRVCLCRVPLILLAADKAYDLDLTDLCVYCAIHI